ncbi:MAG: single-stranded DNA-binding protein [Crocinitomicaceae bacterium]|nr:single-stranded DNA-binding protein [Crocinitomicaceae bacterium]
MNALRNKVSLIGRLGAEPELVTLESGVAFARFTLATNESYKGKDGTWKEITQWHTLKAWGKKAENVSKVLKKGQEIVVEGKLVNENYETKKGEKRYGCSIEVNEFLIVSPKIADAK